MVAVGVGVTTLTLVEGVGVGEAATDHVCVAGTDPLQAPLEGVIVIEVALSLSKVNVLPATSSAFVAVPGVIDPRLAVAV
jgi:hypothetical protein